MKLPPRLANWLRARGRAHEQRVAEHERIMAKVDMTPRYGRKVRVPAPPGGWRTGGGKHKGERRPKYMGRSLPRSRDLARRLGRGPARAARAAESGDPAQIAALLAEDVTFHTPILTQDSRTSPAPARPPTRARSREAHARSRHSPALRTRRNPQGGRWCSSQRTCARQRRLSQICAFPLPRGKVGATGVTTDSFG